MGFGRAQPVAGPRRCQGSAVNRSESCDSRMLREGEGYRTQTISLDAGERDLAGFEDLQLHSMFFEFCEKLACAHLAQVRAWLHAAPRLRVSFHRSDHAAARELRPQITYAEQLFREVIDGAGVLERSE